MNKLEEQLRASRHTEVPGLTPPPGGWEAISGQLANGAAGASSTASSGSGTGATAGNSVAAGSTTAGGSSAAATGIKALVLKWVAGLGATMLVGGGITYAVITGGDATTTAPELRPAANQTTAETAPKTTASPADPATAGPEIIDAVSENAAGPKSKVSASPATKATTTAPATDQQTSNNPLPTKVQSTKPSSQHTVAPSKPATGSRSVLPATNTNTPPTKNDNAQKSLPTEDPTTENIPANTPSPTQAVTPDQFSPVRSTVAAPAPEQPTDKEPITTSQNSAPAAPTADAAGQSQSTLSPNDFASQTDDVPGSDLRQSAVVRPAPKVADADAFTAQADNSGMALLPRSVSPLTLTPALLSSSFTAPVATPPKYDLPKFGRNGKTRAPAFWEYHGSLSANYYQNYKRSAYYERQPGTGPFTFVLPTGETIQATSAFNLSDATPSIEQGFYLKGGINRQASSGFLFRLSAGLSFFDERKDADNFNLISDDLIREDQKSVVWSLPVEVGVQYTFLKRHRLRPYLGMSMIGTLYHNSVQESTFFDGQTMLSGTSERTVSSFYFGGLRDIGLEAGIQYRMNNLWSVGILARASSDLHVYIPAAFGVEVRYSLK